MTTPDDMETFEKDMSRMSQLYTTLIKLRESIKELRKTSEKTERKVEEMERDLSGIRVDLAKMAAENPLTRKAIFALYGGIGTALVTGALGLLFAVLKK